PVLGAVLIFTINDRMSGGGMAELSLIVLAVVLIAATLFLKGGISTRLLERPLPPVVTLVVVTALSIALAQSRVITAFAYGMVAALIVLFLPAGLVPGGRGGRGGAPPPGAAAAPVAAHEHDASTPAQETGR
ncbi:MAG: hypothetical protein KG028_10290, partial [Actinobacteria bacterium]|nr:hypothetical protein [Actinomycetota bacterium]